MKTVDELVAEKRLEQVVSDPETARLELETAKKHLETSEKILHDDPEMAYTALYDGVRKGISAHMRTKGVRATKGPGGHVKHMEYADAVLNAPTSPQTIEDLEEVLERMRTTRNHLDYDGGHIGEEQVRADLEEARLILKALEEALLTEQAEAEEAGEAESPAAGPEDSAAT